MADQAIRRIIEVDVKESAATAAAVRDMQRNLKALERDAKDAKSSLEDAFGGKTGFKLAVFAQIKQGAQELFSTIKDLSGVGIATSIAEVQSGLERLRLGFSSISSGGIQAANDTIDYLRKTTRGLGIDFSTAADAFLKLSAAARGTALDGEKTRNLFESVSLAARNLGLSTEQTQKAFLALQQVISKGVVQQEELRGQLSEALPGAAQIAARAMGLTTAKFNDLVASGKLFAEEFIPRFSAQLRLEFGKELPASLNEATVALNNFKSAYEQMLQSITDGGLGTKAAQQLTAIAAFFDDVATAARNAKGATGDFVQQVAAVAKEFDKINLIRSKRIELAELSIAPPVSVVRGKAPSPPGFDEAVQAQRTARVAQLQKEIAELDKVGIARDKLDRQIADSLLLGSKENFLLDQRTAANTRYERQLNELLKTYKDKRNIEKEQLALADVALRKGDLSPEYYARLVEDIKKKNKVTSEGQKIAEREMESARRLDESIREQIAVQSALGRGTEESKNILKQLAQIEEDYLKTKDKSVKAFLLEVRARALLGEEERKSAQIRIAVLATDKKVDQDTEKRIQNLYREAEATEAEIDTIGSTKEQIRQKTIALKELQLTELELLRTEAIRDNESKDTIAQYGGEIAAILRVIDAKRRLTSKELFGGGFDTSEFDAKKIKEAEEQQRVFSQSLIDNFKRSKNLGKAVVESIKDELDRRVFKMFVEPQVDFLVKQLDKILNSFAEGLKKIIDEYLSTVNGGDGGFVSFLAKLISTGLGGSGSSTGGSQLNYSSDYGNNPSAYVGPSSATSTETRRRASSAPVYSAVTAFAGPTMQGAGNMGGLTVNIINAPEGTTATERQTPNGRILDVIIAQAKDAVAGDITSGGKVGNAIQTTYGISRNTPRVGF